MSYWRWLYLRCSKLSCMCISPESFVHVRSTIVACMLRCFYSMDGAGQRASTPRPNRATVEKNGSLWLLDRSIVYHRERCTIVACVRTLGSTSDARSPAVLSPFWVAESSAFLGTREVSVSQIHLWLLPPYPHLSSPCPCMETPKNIRQYLPKTSIAWNELKSNQQRTKIHCYESCLSEV
jgi:hypothetical protein